MSLNSILFGRDTVYDMSYGSNLLGYTVRYIYTSVFIGRVGYFGDELIQEPVEVGLLNCKEEC